MNVHALLLDRIVGALKALESEGALPAGLDLAGIEVAPPRAAARGDLSSNAALVVAKAAKLKPREIAALVAEKLRVDPDIETVEVTGAGFLNLRFARRFWQSVVAAILAQGSAYGRADLGRGERVGVAYVTPAPTGPLHVGDGRAAVLSDAIANLLAFMGYEVTRACCIGGRGAQIGGLAVNATLAVVKEELATLGFTHDDVRLWQPAHTTGHEAAMDELTRRDFRHLVIVHGTDRAGDGAPMKAAVAALSDGRADLDIKVCGPVKLLRAGEPVHTSRRAGACMTLRQVVDALGRDGVRFTLLYRPHDVRLDVDLAKVADQSKDNPVFYVQYAHARAKSIFRNAQEVFPELREGAPGVVGSDLRLLTDPGEINLIRKLAQLPPLLQGAARAREPHRLAVYLYDLASCFHGQYTLGNDLPHLRFSQPSDGTLTAARLALVQAIAQVLAVGLALLGVLAPLEMR